ncbi:MAG: hypothetical protein P1P89_10760 [Desulfobacterales bacterium]|nr:hypothetical protein [Desulfobacterales bacterium]
MSKLSKLKERLISHLLRKGLEPSLVPGFIRCLAISLKLNPRVDIPEIGQRMNCMGWAGSEIDADTLALATAYFDAQGLEILEEKPVRWFEKKFKAA